MRRNRIEVAKKCFRPDFGWPYFIPPPPPHFTSVKMIFLLVQVNDKSSSLLRRKRFLRVRSTQATGGVQYKVMCGSSSIRQAAKVMLLPLPLYILDVAQGLCPYRSLLIRSSAGEGEWMREPWRVSNVHYFLYFLSRDYPKTFSYKQEQTKFYDLRREITEDFHRLAKF